MKIEKFLKESKLLEIRRAYQDIESKVEAPLKKLDLTLNQALVLVALHGDGSKSTRPSNLAETFGLSRSQVSQILSHLESMQFLRRIVDPKDARSYRLKLNESKRRTVLDVMQTIERGEREVGT